MLRVPKGLAGVYFLVMAACSTQAAPPPETGTPSDAPEAPVKPKEAPDDQGPLFQPFVGEQDVVDGGSVNASYEFVGEHEGKLVVALTLEEAWRAIAFRKFAVGSKTTPVLPEAMMFLDSRAASLEFVLPSDEDPKSGSASSDLADRLWLLVEPGRMSDLDATLYANFARGGSRGPVVKLKVQPQGALPATTPDAESMWGRALSRYLDGLQDSELASAYAERLDEIYGEPGEDDSSASWRGALDGGSDIAELMSLVSGHDSVERALRYREGQAAGARHFKPTVALSSLEIPVARRHDWARMLRGLLSQHPVPKISQSVPAEFYFVHAKSGESLFLLLDELSRFLTPAAHLLEQRGAGYRLSERYQTQLGLVRGPLSRALGPKVIREVAVVGSDPFLRVGSDVTILFEASNRAVLQAGLAEALHRAASGRGPLDVLRSEVRGRQLVHSRTSDGAVSQFMVVEGTRIYVSNSQAALERVLAAADGKHDRLSDEADFRYMMRRDENAPYDVIAYAGDRFVAEIVSPRARVLDARRLLARGELKRVGRAALLSGLMGREVNSDPKALLKSGLLAAHQGSHFDGSPIEKGPHSTWGSPGSMIPLIDLPTPEKVTKAEKTAYESFVRGYNFDWGEEIDPIALRMKLNAEGTGFEAHLRILPIVNGREYREIREFVGGQRLRFRGSALGAQAVLAIAEDSGLRRDLIGASHQVLGQALELDWVGEYAFLGLEDRNALTQIFSPFAPSEQRLGEGDELERLASLPAYLGVNLKSRAGAELTMALLRAAIPTSAGVKWNDPRDYKGVTIHSLHVAEMGTGIQLFYAIGKETLFFALQERTIRRLIDVEEKGLLPVAHEQGRAQFALETRQRPGGGLSTVLAWMFEDEVLKHLAPEREQAHVLAMALHAEPTDSKQIDFMQLVDLIGEIPITPDGFYFQQSPFGVRDPERGNFVRARFPKLPIAGSYVDLVLGKLKLARFELAFEPEAPGRGGERGDSLSVHMTLERE